MYFADCYLEPSILHLLEVDNMFVYESYKIVDFTGTRCFLHNLETN